MNQRAASVKSPRPQGKDYLLAAAVTGVIALLFMAWKSDTIHWFLLPLFACGVLAGVDVVRWVRGRLDTFDPKAVVGLIAFYGFFMAPLLHVAWDRYGVLGDLDVSGDWRYWLGAMAGLNALGLLCYQMAQSFFYARTSPARLKLEINPKTFPLVVLYTLALSILGQLYFLWQVGGFEGLIRLKETDPEAFLGKGWLLLFAWPMTIVSFIAVTWLITQKRSEGRGRLLLGLALVGVFGVAHFFLLGLRGSRSETVWALFWMGGILHYRFRKMSPLLATLGISVFIAFMYFYGFYKERGTEAVEMVMTPGAWTEAPGYLRDYKTLLLLDLARADVNACLLNNLVLFPKAYNYRWGLTYIGAFTVVVPRNLWPNRPEFKKDAGTDALYGKTLSWESRRVYGLSGEALLNFGPLGVAPLWILFGVVMGWYRRKFVSWQKDDTRLLLAPFVTLLFVVRLIGDSDNLVFTAVSEGTLATACLLISSRVLRLQNRPELG
ncbi:MAG: hypothetical protein ACRD35_05330 [Candidatus Acidiferrales bacterium]